MCKMRDLFFERYWEENEENSQEHVKSVGEAIWDLAEHFEVGSYDKRWREIEEPRVLAILRTGGNYLPYFSSAIFISLQSLFLILR